MARVRRFRTVAPYSKSSPSRTAPTMKTAPSAIEWSSSHCSDARGWLVGVVTNWARSARAPPKLVIVFHRSRRPARKVRLHTRVVGRPVDAGHRLGAGLTGERSGGDAVAVGVVGSVGPEVAAVGHPGEHEVDARVEVLRGLVEADEGPGSVDAAGAT